ncbi:MAG: hypothetical protein LBT25_04855 [Candidatus Symbiothrix sp.]|jgi:hypothetical protein|nr:hypothetical protein [Candidatus Symbiothrix sp.]
MKNKILLLAVLSWFTLTATAQEKKVTWDYPVKPGMKEWKKLDSNEEMVTTCQIPEKILSFLSTEDLAILCLQYPLLYDVFAFNDLNEGLNKLFDDFNGIRELYKRRDASGELLRQYNLKIQNFSFLDSKASDTEKGLFIISISALEVLLCQLTTKNEELRETPKETLYNLVSGYEQKSKYAEYFKGFGFRTNYYSRIHVILKINNSNEEKLSQKRKNAVLFSGVADKQTINVIDELSYQLIR